MSLPLGLIEAFYGRPYTWAERADMVRFLADEGYDHYIYAPKADASLRREWTRQHDAEDAGELQRFGAHCRQHGLAWGVGLSPTIRTREDSQSFQAQLLARVEQLLELNLDRLALLFDDVPGHPGLADQQCAAVNSIRERFPEVHLMVCPTYYTTSPVLDRVFGARPARYLEELGAGLDARIDVMWTGPNVCSKEYPTTHLHEVAAILNRRPWIWDNYPVNDGPRMFRFLRLRGFPPRTRALAARVSGISVNPMNQAWLSRLSLASLPAALRLDAPLDRDQAFVASGMRLLPLPLLEQLQSDLPRFHDDGLDSLSPLDVDNAIRTYSGFEHPAAAEIVSWLRGETRVGEDTLMG